VTHRFERTTCFCLSSIENENKEAAVEQRRQHLWLTTTVLFII